MGTQFAFIIPESFKINVAVVSLSFEYDYDNLSIVWSNSYKDKIKRVLKNIHNNINFIVFPEYSYNVKLEKIFSRYSCENEVVIIGGSATEEVSNAFYAYSPIFFPDGSIKKVYKKRITSEEKAISSNRIISYPDINTRNFQYEINEKTISFCVFICNDFLQESHPDKNNRNDIYFVPQYEKNVNLFVNQAYIYSTEISSYVFGANFSKDGYRSIGTSILNSTTISGLVVKKFRLPEYRNNWGPEHYDKSIIYDIDKEKILLFSIDLGIPSSLATGNSQIFESPIVYPIDSINI